jgi:hypothetical protein
METLACHSLLQIPIRANEIVELHCVELVPLLYFVYDASTSASASGSVSVNASGRSCDRLCIYLWRGVSIGLVTSWGMIDKEGLERIELTDPSSSLESALWRGEEAA